MNCNVNYGSLIHRYAYTVPCNTRHIHLGGLICGHCVKVSNGRVKSASEWIALLWLNTPTTVYDPIYLPSKWWMNPGVILHLWRPPFSRDSWNWRMITNNKQLQPSSAEDMVTARLKTVWILHTGSLRWARFESVLISTCIEIWELFTHIPSWRLQVRLCFMWIKADRNQQLSLTPLHILTFSKYVAWERQSYNAIFYIR